MALGSSPQNAKLTYDPDSLENRDRRVIDSAAQFVESAVLPYHRAEIMGTDRIPEGRAMYVGNHNGGLLSIDTFIGCYGIYRDHGLEALPYGLVHDVMISNPVTNRLLAPLGGVRASRENAHRVFEAGHKLLVYPGGDVEAMRPYRERNRIKFAQRRGYIRMALRHDVPIVPMVAAGAHSTFIVLDDLRGLPQSLGIDEFFRVEVWPIMFSIPWGLTIGPSPPYFPLPAKIRVGFLNPISFERSGTEAADDDLYVRLCADKVERRMQRALDQLNERGQLRSNDADTQH